MKLLIAGSRSITEFDLTPHIPTDVDLIITGGAKGVDALGEQYAREHGIPTVTVKPVYEKYGRAAPIRRDEEMVDMADAVLVVWDGVSRGSRHTAEYARKQGKRLVWLTV
jgi:predicted Rossmann fold nucleotide-binding protein DprA/Smf involved in DNA uptake